MNINQLKVNRSFASLSLLVAFIGLLTSALFMFFADYQPKVSVLHICFSIQFVVSLVLHLINNLPSLVRYWRKIQIVSVALLLSAGLTLGSLLQFMPFNLIYDFEQSKKLDGKKITSQEIIRYDLLRYKGVLDEVKLDSSSNAYPISLNLDVINKIFNYSMVVWLEDGNGAIKDVLGFVVTGARKQINEYPVLLPHFASKNPKNISNIAKVIRNNKSMVLTMGSDAKESLVLKMEINFFNDANDFYPINRKGTMKEKDGQPSIVYQAKLNKEVQWLELLGKTNSDGEIIPNTDDITTALNKFNSLLLEVK